MPTALCVIRNEASYRKEFFVEGLKACGFRIAGSVAHQPRPDDVLVVWNRHGAHNGHAQRFEHAGAKVIVVENAWIGKDKSGHKLYAMCLDHHNGAGRWRVGDGDRWSTFGIALQPWRPQGEHILLLPARGIGEPGIAQPRDWPDRIATRLAAATGRPVRVRLHPGIRLRLNDAAMPPLEPDLENCWAVVTWASGAAVKAIVAGIPAFYEMPQWIAAGAAKHGIDEIERPFLGDRLPALKRMAWAMWGSDEIATGAPIRWLLRL